MATQKLNSPSLDTIYLVCLHCTQWPGGQVHIELQGHGVVAQGGSGEQGNIISTCLDMSLYFTL